MPTSLNTKVSKARARPDKVRTNILSVLHRYERTLKKELQRTTDHWKDPTDIPDFKTAIHFGRRDPDAVVEAGPAEDGSRASDIWRFLDQGTSIRWAELSEDWESKTSPGSMASGEGAGRVLIAGRAMVDEGLPPRPGIEARDWTGQLIEEYGPKYIRDIKKAVRSGLKG